MLALVGYIVHKGYQRQGVSRNGRLTEVDNHTELPLLFFCVAQDRKDRTQGHMCVLLMPLPANHQGTFLPSLLSKKVKIIEARATFLPLLIILKAAIIEA